MTTRSRTSTPVQYEDFLPKSEWMEETGSYILVLYLPPEFKKEQIKITYVQSTQMIRVNGERPLVNNKWSRFNKAFQIPQSCDVNKIEARYQNGVLTLSMPKTRPTITPQPAIAAKEELKPPQQVTPPLPPPPPPKEPASKSPLKQTNDKTTTMTTTAVTTQTPPKPPLGPTPPKAVESTLRIDDLKDRTTKKSQEETAQQVAPTKDSQKRKDDTSFPQEDESSKKRKEKVVVERGGDEESSKKRKEYSVSDVKSEGLKKEEDEDKAIEDFIVEKVKLVKGLAIAAKRNIQEFSMEANEDRQAMVNVGVAVLVIVALGTYIFYSRGSSRSAK